jgi:hypothetical protein
MALSTTACFYTTLRDITRLLGVSWTAMASLPFSYSMIIIYSWNLR